MGFEYLTKTMGQMIREAYARGWKPDLSFNSKGYDTSKGPFTCDPFLGDFMESDEQSDKPNFDELYPVDDKYYNPDFVNGLRYASEHCRRWAEAYTRRGEKDIASGASTCADILDLAIESHVGDYWRDNSLSGQWVDAKQPYPKEEKSNGN